MNELLPATPPVSPDDHPSGRRHRISSRLAEPGQIATRNRAGGRNGRSLGRIGSLEVRIAASGSEVRRAQGLRHQVFFREGAAASGALGGFLRRDADSFDRVCDHLLVVDHDTPASPLRSGPEIVGTYRLLRQDVAERHDGFYTAGEFEIGPLLARKSALRFLELGRSCVLEPYRTKRTLELLWHGIWTYVLQHRIDVMFGCGSLAGTDPDTLALPLSFLHHNALAPGEWLVRAREHLRVDMNRMPADTIETRAAMRALPPLVKGYLRLGAFVGDGAVVDRRFGSTDVCIVLPVARLSERYVAHYGCDAGRFAA